MNDENAITGVVTDYFKGTYHGDATRLKKAFHVDAHITGSLNGKICAWSRDDFISRVTTTPTSAEKNEKYDKKIIFVDQTGDAAIIKACVVVNEIIFTDYLTLLKINGKWIIRNKSFTT